MFATLVSRLRPAAPKTRAVDPAEAGRLLAERARLRRRADRLAEQIGAVEGQLAALLDGAEEAVSPDGGILYSYRQDGTFASRRFSDDHPAVAAEFTRMMPSLDVKALAAARPDLYRRYRAAVLRVR